MSKSPNWSAFEFGDGIAAAAISDLHLGHAENDTRRMCQAIKKNIIHSGLISRIKLLLLCGDTFDHLLTLNDPNAIIIDNLIMRLYKACEKHGVTMRVLRGTPSHDLHQTERFAHLYAIGKFTFNFAYFNVIDIEYIEHLDTTILYIPDEASTTTQITQDVVKARMLAKGIEHVDLACMHGMFPHQLGFKVKPSSVHDDAFYSSIVRDWILIGHVHKHTAQGKILVPSSHDRLRQNEEDPKGFLVFTYKTPKPKFWFIENHDAHIHKTIEVYGLTVEAAMKTVDDFLEGQKEKCFIRVEAESGHPLFSLFKELVQKWPAHSIVPFVRQDKDKEEQVQAEEADEKWTSLIIDKNNIKDLLFARISTKHNNEQALRCTALLENCL